MEERFIRPAGAARLAGVSLATVRRWLDDPAVPIVKYRDGSGRVWVDRNEVIDHVTPRPAARPGVPCANH